MSGYDYSNENFSRLEAQNGLPAGFLSALMQDEASSDSAVSPKGAVGRLQNLPSTAASPGYGVPPYDPRDPAGVARYVKALYERSGKNPRLTAAAYNAGLGGDYTNHETANYLARFDKMFGKTNMPTDQPVIAELSDGRRLEFPAGTSPDIVQQTVKKVIANGTSQNGGGSPAGAPAAGGVPMDGSGVGGASPVSPVAKANAPLGWQQQLQAEMMRRLMKTDPAKARSLAAQQPEFVPDVPGAPEALQAVGKALGFGQKAAQTPLQAAGEAAQKAGYKVPPSQVNPNVINRFLEGFGGKTQLGQRASVLNQETTNTLAKRALGLPQDQPITQAALDTIQSNAGKEYDTLRNVQFDLRADAQYEKTIADLSKNWNQAAKKFPFMKNGQIEDLISDLSQKQAGPGGKTVLSKIKPSDAVDAIKDLRAKARANFRALDNPGQQALARAQNDAAKALEDLFERNLQAKGDFTTYTRFRSARTAIARSIDVERALNPATGNVSANYFANALKKGRPITQELESIGKAGQAFPQSTRDVEKIGAQPGFSVLDLFGSAANPKWLAAVLGRPAVREYLLSQLGQKGISPAAKARILQLLQPPAQAAKAGTTAAGMNQGE